MKNTLAAGGLFPGTGMNVPDEKEGQPRSEKPVFGCGPGRIRQQQQRQDRDASNTGGY